MKAQRILAVAGVALLAAAVATEAIGQRRGGGGRGGMGGRMGGGGARPSFSRSPSMSRIPSRPAMPSRPAPSRPAPNRPSLPNRPAPSRPSLPQGGLGAARPSLPQRPQTRPAIPNRPAARPATPSRPSRNDLQGFLNLPQARPGTGVRPGGGLPSNRPSTRPATPGIDRDKIKQGIANRPAGRPEMPDWFKPGAGGDRPTTLPGQIGNRPGNRPGVGRPPGGRPPAARPPIAGGRPPRYPWNPRHPYHGRYRYGYWWRGATVVGLTSWVTPVWSTPVYCTYGEGGSVYYENNNVYVDGSQYATATEYYDQATTIAAAAPQVDEAEADEIEWMPLGVFALTSEGVSASSMYLQLAISKDAVIAGTFYNETTGVTHPVEGMVDEESQRAAWRAADDTNPDIVMETAVFNLTQDETDALVHFGPDETQVWKMVRLDESDAPEAPAEASADG